MLKTCISHLHPTTGFFILFVFVILVDWLGVIKLCSVCSSLRKYTKKTRCFFLLKPMVNNNNTNILLSGFSREFFGNPLRIYALVSIKSHLDYYYYYIRFTNYKLCVEMLFNTSNKILFWQSQD